MHTAAQLFRLQGRKPASYDGLNPHPPTYYYLKPYYLPLQTSYFEHARKGAL